MKILQKKIGFIEKEEKISAAGEIFLEIKESGGKGKKISAAGEKIENLEKNLTEKLEIREKI